MRHHHNSFIRDMTLSFNANTCSWAVWLPHSSESSISYLTMCDIIISHLTLSCDTWHDSVIYYTHMFLNSHGSPMVLCHQLYMWPHVTLSYATRLIYTWHDSIIYYTHLFLSSHGSPMILCHRIHMCPCVTLSCHTWLESVIYYIHIFLSNHGSPMVLCHQFIRDHVWLYHVKHDEFTNSHLT